MVEHQEAALDAVFHALGDGTRRQMLRSLAQGERTVGQLAEPFRMSLAAASKHIKALEGAGLIRREAGPLSSANEWLSFYEQFWGARLDRLEALLRQDAKAPAKSSPQSATPRKRTPR